MTAIKVWRGTPLNTLYTQLMSGIYYQITTPRLTRMDTLKCLLIFKVKPIYPDLDKALNSVEFVAYINSCCYNIYRYATEFIKIFYLKCEKKIIWKLNTDYVWSKFREKYLNSGQNLDSGISVFIYSNFQNIFR